jgi:very-short-patch-repair endonuclease
MIEAELMARQCGVFSRAQALRAGISATTITRRVAHKEWRAVFPGVYRHAAVVVSDEVMMHAALLWAGADAVLSGSWAAWLHGFRERPSGPVSVTVPRTSAARTRPDLMVHRRPLPDADVTCVRGVRVVSRARAALECAQSVDGQDVVDRALQRHVPVPELVGAMDRFARAHGASSARRSVELVVDGTVSPAERSLAAAFRRAGLTQIRAGVHVWVGGRRFWLDFAVEALKLAIEVDGVSAHSDPAAFHRDRERQNLLVRDGWTVLRYTPHQLKRDMPAVIDEIRSTLSALGG